jgi:hypothetical protein
MRPATAGRLGRASRQAAVLADPPAADGERLSGLLELAVVVVISAAGLMTSWASYQADLWNGTQTAHYGRASAARMDSSRVALNANMTRTFEVGLFSDWLRAKDERNESLAVFFERRFPPDFQPYFAEWIAQRPFENPAAAPSPFLLPSYRQQGVIDADRLMAEAETQFTAGQRANTVSNSYTRGAVLMATAMFFGGVGQVFRLRSVRIVLAIVAFLSCAAGLVQIFTLPALALHL